MKQLMLSLSMAIVFALASCQKDTPVSPTNTTYVGESNFSSSPASVSKDQVTPSTKAYGLTEYNVSPCFGKPNVTNYYFSVYDPIGSSALAVKIYEKASGSTSYLPMMRSGIYWVLSIKIVNSGWYDWRYVYNLNKANISGNAYMICNTNNTFSASGTSSITWPFGSDGSGWNNRTVYFGGVGQTWRGGEETKNTSFHIGYGWNEGTHTGYDEQYSDDWNRGNGSQDLGALVRSPLDGYIAEYGTYSTSYGNSLYVAVVQVASDGRTYRFYVGHLQGYASGISVGKYVRAGIDPIGYVGSSGASSPHAHTSLRDVTNNARTSMKFQFNAN